MPAFSERVLRTIGVFYFVESSTCASQGNFYSSSHMEAAYFLHSLHALTNLLCFHETHRKLLPVAVCKDVIEQLCDEDKASLGG